MSVEKKKSQVKFLFIKNTNDFFAKLAEEIIMPLWSFGATLSQRKMLNNTK